ncbi:hypothetical protein [Streptomyces griseus]|uniref:hypothetical protein n=1 Tax=Streptomyces griseus TaxID=1911 RepID=UPI0036857A81
MPEKKTYPGCAIMLFIVAVLSIVGSCGSSSDDTEYTPEPTQPTLRDPGYSGSLCEGDDYLVYDDCQ